MVLFVIHKNDGEGDPFNPASAPRFTTGEALTPQQDQLINEASATAAQVYTDEQCLHLFELAKNIQDFAPETALLLQLEGVGQLFFANPHATNIGQRNRIENLLLETMQQTALELHQTPNAKLHDETSRALLREIERRAKKATKPAPIILEGDILVDYTTEEVDQEAMDALAELGVSLQLNTGQLAWLIGEATQRIQEGRRQDVVSAQEAYELGNHWPELPSLVDAIRITEPQASLNYVSPNPIPEILLDTYLFFVADKEDGIASVPEKPIAQIIEELTAKGEDQNENERLYLSFATELQQWHEDGGFDTFTHSEADRFNPYQGYESSSFYGNSIVVRKDEEGCAVNNAPRVLADETQPPSMFAFAAACHKTDRLVYVDPPDFTFKFAVDEHTARTFETLKLENRHAYVPLDIDFTQLLNFCSKITGTVLPDNFYPQLQQQRDTFNREIASPTHWVQFAVIHTDEVGVSFRQTFNDETSLKKPELLEDGTMRIWAQVGTWGNGIRYHDLPEVTMSTYQLYDEQDDLFEHFKQSARRAAIFNKT